MISNKTIKRTITIPEDLWTQSVLEAKDNGQKFSTVIQRLLDKWLAGDIPLAKSDKKRLRG